MILPVNEIFETIQGEATWTGTPSVFVRMQGCDVGCPWCDTKHTWKVDPVKAVGTEAILAKTQDSDEYARFNPGHLAQIVCLQSKARHVVITGGEPCDYDLTDLTTALHIAGRTTQIETSGTRPVLCDARTWVTVSPKFSMPGGYAVLPQAMLRANEIKMPVGKPVDVEAVREVQRKMIDAGAWTDRFPIWLQPLSQSPKATALCVQAATEHGFRVSVQTHKFLNLR